MNLIIFLNKIVNLFVRGNYTTINALTVPNPLSLETSFQFAISEDLNIVEPLPYVYNSLLNTNILTRYCVLNKILSDFGVI